MVVLYLSLRLQIVIESQGGVSTLFDQLTAGLQAVRLARLARRTGADYIA
jgi:hypothetical protein